MQKLRLDLDALKVDAFETEGPEGRPGTVGAAEQTATVGNNATCPNTCQNTCAGTCPHPLAPATCWTCVTCAQTCAHTCANPQQPCQG